MKCCNQKEGGRDEARQKVIQRWIEESGADGDCETSIRNLLKDYPHKELCRGFVVRDIRSGLDRGLIVERYCLTLWEFRQIAIQIGHYRPIRF